MHTHIILRRNEGIQITLTHVCLILILQQGFAETVELEQIHEKKFATHVVRRYSTAALSQT